MSTPGECRASPPSPTCGVLSQFESWCIHHLRTRLLGTRIEEVLGTGVSWDSQQQAIESWAIQTTHIFQAREIRSSSSSSTSPWQLWALPQEVERLLKRMNQNPEQLCCHMKSTSSWSGGNHFRSFPVQWWKGALSSASPSYQAWQRNYEDEGSIRWQDGPSLNKCLYTGPNFGQNMLDSDFNFIVSHLWEAFLMVIVTEMFWGS